LYQIVVFWATGNDRIDWGTRARLVHPAYVMPEREETRNDLFLRAL
jgi:hypothetical protein